MLRKKVNPSIYNDFGLEDIVTVNQGGTGVDTEEDIDNLFDVITITDINVPLKALGLNSSSKIDTNKLPSSIGILNELGKIPDEQVNITGDEVGLIGGELSIPINSQTTFTISNYDIVAAYIITPISGTIVRNNNTITYTAPNTVGTYGFIVNGKTFNIDVNAGYVTAPSITSPAHQGTDITIAPVVTSSSFTYNGSVQTHTASEWQIATDSGFSNIVRTINNGINLTSWSVSPSLSYNTQYYIRVRYQGNLTGWSEWSPVSVFTTSQTNGWLIVLDSTATDEFYRLKYSPDGQAIYAVGYMSGQYSLLIKFDTSGSIVWQKRYIGNTGIESFKDVTVSSDSQYIYICGYSLTNSFGNSDFVIMKFDSNGNSIWNKYMSNSGYQYFESIDISSDDQYLYVSGMNTQSTQNGSEDCALMKFSADDGSLIWQKGIGGNSGNEWFYRVHITPDGQYIYAIGNEQSQTAGSIDGYITKWNASDGTLVWQKSVGTANVDRCYDSCMTSDGEYVYMILQSWTGSVMEGLIIKVNSSGTVVWQRAINKSGISFYAQCINISPDNQFVYVGGSITATAEAFICKVDTINNSIVWQYSIGNSNSEYFKGIAVSPDGSFISICGYQYLPTYLTSASIFTINDDGNVTLGALTGTGLTSVNIVATTFSLLTRSLSTIDRTLVLYTTAHTHRNVINAMENTSFATLNSIY